MAITLKQLLLVLCLNISIVLGQEYKAWEKHDIEGIYIMAKSKDEAKNYNNVLREGADYYIPTEQEDQVLFIRVSKRITPKLYKLKDGEMYILFSFPPFLFDSDEGMGINGYFIKSLHCKNRYMIFNHYLYRVQKLREYEFIK